MPCFVTVVTEMKHEVVNRQGAKDARDAFTKTKRNTKIGSELAKNGWRQTENSGQRFEDGRICKYSTLNSQPNSNNSQPNSNRQDARDAKKLEDQQQQQSHGMRHRPDLPDRKTSQSRLTSGCYPRSGTAKRMEVFRSVIAKLCGFLLSRLLI